MLNRYLLSYMFFSTVIILLQLITPVYGAWFSSASNVKQQLLAEAPNIKPKVLDHGLKVYRCALKKNLDKKHILTIIDYSLPSNKRRMWIFDMDDQSLLYNTYVAHGKGSGMRYSKRFSNKRGSHATSLGVLLTGRTYYGHRGYSLRLHGLEKGFNDKVFPRHVVIHPAWYANKKFLKQYGRLGRSYGCPAISRRHSREIIDAIKNRTVVVAYYPSDRWLDHSKYLQCS